MAKNKYKMVIFDFDDTLVESRAAKWNQHKYVAKKFYNIDVTEEELLKQWGKPLNILVGELYQNSDTLENMYAALTSTKDDFQKKIYKESINTVNKLLENNIKVGVISATTKFFLIEDLKRFGFPIDKFSIIQGADETPVHKPNPDVFLPLFEKYLNKEIEKNEIVYIGDSIDDFKAATDAGIDFIAVTTGLYSDIDFKKLGAKNITKGIHEIINKVI